MKRPPSSLVGLAFALFACAQSESVPGGGGGGGAAAVGGLAGSSGNLDGAADGDATSTGGWPSGGSGGGFPDGAGSGASGGSSGASAGGSGGTTDACTTEICNGQDDDCDGQTDEGVCGAGCTGKQYQYHAYVFCSTDTDLSSAAEDCVGKGMKLARVNDSFENDFIRTTGTGFGLAGIWLGATDWATEGSWLWPDGAQFWTGGANGNAVGGLYANWAANEPNGGGGADCVVMDATGTWADTDCNGKSDWVCEAY